MTEDVKLVAKHVLIEGEANELFPSFLSPKRICSKLIQIPVLNFKSNDIKEMALIDIKYLTTVKLVINEMIKNEDLSRLNYINFKNASLKFSYIQVIGDKTKIQEETMFEFVKFNSNEIEIRKFNGEVLKENKIIRNKVSYNKLSDLHELDEENWEIFL